MSSEAQNCADMDGYLTPLGMMANSALHISGVADGLQVSAGTSGTELRISPGTALDAQGRFIVLTEGGTAVADGVSDAADPQILPVRADGVAFPTAGRSPGEYRLTVSWHEIEGSFEVLGTQQSGLLHAPLLGLVPAAESMGPRVVLAQVTLGTAGQVQGVAAGSRHAVGLAAETLEFRGPSLIDGAATSIGHVITARLAARRDGGVDLNLVAPDGAERCALSVDGASGRLRMPTGVTGDLGIGSAQPRRSLHVEGTEVHSGGPGGGFSFADRTAASGAFVESPTSGQRWSWYAKDGHARLASGAADHLVVGTGSDGDALDVPRRMRVRQGGDNSAGIWFRQRSSATADNAFVGMQDDTHIGFYGQNGGWGLVMDTTSGGAVHANSLQVGPVTAERLDTPYVQAGRLDTPYVQAERLDTKYVQIAANPGLLAESVAGGIGVTGNFGYNALKITGTGHIVNQGGNYTSLVVEQVTPGGYAAISVKGGPIRLHKYEGNTYSIYADQTIISNQGLVSRDHIVKLDHPLDPENKNLSHSAVQAPDMTSLYDGTVVTDEKGEATISLPDYVEALNRDFHYQLTPVSDRPVVATVVQEIAQNSFTVRTDTPGTKVCWQVTGTRHDPWARANRVAVESDKPEEERGTAQFTTLPEPQEGKDSPVPDGRQRNEGHAAGPSATSHRAPAGVPARRGTTPSTGAPGS
ncbi:hypothetical protein [Streptomyces sp. NPDC005476]|uniref:hypothetical protein n=1 Tax=Streptomyces sp. NPDC005476 TaxID=3156882 RepID=UPI00345425E1